MRRHTAVRVLGLNPGMWAHLYSLGLFYRHCIIRCCSSPFSPLYLWYPFLWNTARIKQYSWAFWIVLNLSAVFKTLCSLAMLENSFGDLRLCSKWEMRNGGHWFDSVENSDMETLQICNKMYIVDAFVFWNRSEKSAYIKVEITRKCVLTDVWSTVSLSGFCEKVSAFWSWFYAFPWWDPCSRLLLSSYFI